MLTIYLVSSRNLNCRSVHFTTDLLQINFYFRDKEINSSIFLGTLVPTNVTGKVNATTSAILNWSLAGTKLLYTQAEQYITTGALFTGLVLVIQSSRLSHPIPPKPPTAQPPSPAALSPVSTHRRPWRKGDRRSLQPLLPGESKVHKHIL